MAAHRWCGGWQLAGGHGRVDAAAAVSVASFASPLPEQAPKTAGKAAGEELWQTIMAGAPAIAGMMRDVPAQYQRAVREDLVQVAHRDHPRRFLLGAAALASGAR